MTESLHGQNNWNVDVLSEDICATGPTPFFTAHRSATAPITTGEVSESGIDPDSLVVELTDFDPNEPFEIDNL